MKNKITTRCGDQGSTSLANGSVVTKDNALVEAYGTIDELNSQIGVLRAMDLPHGYNEMLLTIQRRLFAIGAALSGCTYPKNMPVHADIEALENFIDQAPAFHGFVLPGGHPSAAQCHVCRTVCRRAERRIVACQRHDLIPFVNRLSDFFFAMALILNVFYGADEKSL